ncbi:MAG: OsmC family protein [Candidatus Bathyarchaeia archaeon]
MHKPVICADMAGHIGMVDSRVFNFNVKLCWDGETGGHVYIRGQPMLRLDTPTEFGGRGRYPCPDEIFLSSIAGCLLTTFLYFKDKLQVKVGRLKVSAEGTLSFDVEGYRIEGVEAHLYVESDGGDEEDLRRCVELTKRYCHITRTLEKAFPVRILEDIHGCNCYDSVDEE